MNIYSHIDSRHDHLCRCPSCRADSETVVACRTCGEPIRREWVPADVTLREYHAGCRPGAGRIPYHLPVRPIAPDPWDGDVQTDITHERTTHS